MAEDNELEILLTFEHIHNAGAIFGDILLLSNNSTQARLLSNIPMLAKTWCPVLIISLRYKFFSPKCLAEVSQRTHFTSV